MDAAEFWNYPIPNPYNDDKPQPVAGLVSYIGSRQGISEAVVKKIQPQIDDLKTALANIRDSLVAIENKLGI
jgi:hypothetical protein